MKKFFKRLFTDWLFTCKFFCLYGLGTLTFTICVGEFNTLSFCCGVLVTYVMWLVAQIPFDKLPGWLRRFLSKFDAPTEEVPE